MSDEILNPDIYLNYLQPVDANAYEVARNVYLVTLGALLWDILSSLPEDWQLIRTSKPTPVLFAYFSARICALVVALLSVFVKTGPVTNCGVIVLNVRVFWVVTTTASSYLFLKRVHAVFHQERIVCRIFTILWLAAFGATLVGLPTSLDAYSELANTKHCIARGLHSYESAAFIALVIFDGLVFLAITYKILVFHGTSEPRSWKAVFCGDALPRLSLAVLQGGQRYYMYIFSLTDYYSTPNFHDRITTAFNVTRPFLAFLPPASPVLRLASSAIPSVALTSAMACRVFRNLRLESSRETEVGVMAAVRFVQLGPVNVHLPKSGDGAAADVDLEQM
ncbi:hypothetical protein BU15DRAFT_73444 [Melanogaster broomeanus]|nr:hypothetical protein BU15DRAFT_73444 [Melanogaster broomeanus]